VAPSDCKTVLVVDDDRDIREVLTDALEAEGYRVVTAADGQEALDWLRSGARPCIILLDLMMPKMDGIQFRTEVLNDAELACIPVVVLSADPSAIVAAKSLSFAGSLRKPVPLEALLAAVHAHCA
jgi:two-component system, chemotaxis family, chemotaxis protein CheY